MHITRNLTHPWLLGLKAALFVTVALISGAQVWLDAPSAGNAALLFVSGVACARAYYFLFYVLEHWVDASLRYNGLWPLLSQIHRQRVEHSRKYPSTASSGSSECRQQITPSFPK